MYKVKFENVDGLWVIWVNGEELGQLVEQYSWTGQRSKKKDVWICQEGQEDFILGSVSNQAEAKEMIVNYLKQEA